jgi:hypothetical protein
VTVANEGAANNNKDRIIMVFIDPHIVHPSQNFSLSSIRKGNLTQTTVIPDNVSAIRNFSSADELAGTSPSRHIFSSRDFAGANPPGVIGCNEIKKR